MSTVQTTPDRRHYLTPTSQAQWAYAAMTGVLLAGFAAVALPGVPSMNLGIAVVLIAAVAMGFGGLLEKDTVTTVAAFFGGLTGHMVVVTSVTERDYSHRTLAGMFLSVVAVLFAVARFVHARQARRARRARAGR